MQRYAAALNNLISLTCQVLVIYWPSTVFLKYFHVTLHGIVHYNVIQHQTITNLMFILEF